MRDGPQIWTYIGTLFVLGIVAFRIYRLIAKDTILDTPRSWLVRLPKDWEEGKPIPRGYRAKLAEFLTCPWCMGFWICGLVLGTFYLAASPDWDWLDFGAGWFAMSAFVGLLSKLDQED